jgi:hypothetical protein
MRSPLLRATAAIGLCLALAGCGGSQTAVDNDANLDVQGARFALTFGDIVRGRRTVSNRASARLGVFTGMYLSGGGFLASNSARIGVLAQVKYHAKPGEEQLENTFQLLTEFGGVLGVDLADLLNRSTDRTDTLNAYVEGLENITERCTLRLAELRTQLTDLQLEQREARTAAATLDRNVRTALREEDYVTAGELQPDLAQAQAKVAEMDSRVRQHQQIIGAYDDLLEVSERRQLAIDQNREILIAGLKVVDVPGAEALGVLEQQSVRRRIGF